MISLPPSIKAVVVSLHPSHAFRGMPQLLPQIQRTIKRARQISTFGVQRPAVNVIFAKRSEQVREYLRANPGPISIDIETPGKHDSKTITIVGLSAGPGTGIVFRWNEDFADVMAEVLQDPKRLKLGHNFAFDQHAFIANGIDPVLPVADTIVAEAALYPPFKEAKKRRWLALSTCIARHVAGWPYHKEPYTDRTKALYRVWFPDVPEGLYPLLYCTLDAIGTLLLWNQQKEKLKRAGMWTLFTEVLCPAAFEIVKMEEHGIPIDDEKRRAIIEECEKRITVLTKKVYGFANEKHQARVTNLQGQMTKLIGQRDEIKAAWDAEKALISVKGKAASAEKKVLKEKWSPQSKALTPKIAKIKTKLGQVGEEFDWQNENHWRWLLFADAGLGLIPTRVSEKTGSPGVKKDDIEQLQKLYPDCEILQWRVDLKDAGRRKELFEKLVPDASGRVRFAFAIHRTENGRFSSGLDEDEDDKTRESQGGNAQNITKKDREIFVAPPGYVWIDLDMKQVELRVMAWLAGEWDLIRLLMEGGDIHSENGAAIFGCKPEEARAFKVWFGGKADTARQGGKKASHSWDYGAQAKKTGDTFRPWQGRSFEEMMEFLFGAGDGGLTQESYARRLKAAERSTEPEIETKKLRMRLFEMANTITAKRWITAYFKRWRMLAEFQKMITRKVDQERELRNSFGRVLQFWNFRFDDDLKKWFCSDREEALAFWPASDVGDMAKVLLPLIAADARRFGGQLVTTTHDSFSCLIPDDYLTVREFIKIARKTMERIWPQYREHPEFGKFFVPADVSIGLNWGEFDPKKPELNPGGQREWREDNGQTCLHELKAVRTAGRVQTPNSTGGTTSAGTGSSAPTV